MHQVTNEMKERTTLLMKVFKMFAIGRQTIFDEQTCVKGE